MNTECKYGAQTKKLQGASKVKRRSVSWQCSHWCRACVCRVLDGAEAMCVVRALIDSSPVLDESRGLSLLDETQRESLLKCLMCWQRQYGPFQVLHRHTHAGPSCW